MAKQSYLKRRNRKKRFLKWKEALRDERVPSQGLTKVQASTSQGVGKLKGLAWTCEVLA